MSANRNPDLVYTTTVRLARQETLATSGRAEKDSQINVAMAPDFLNAYGTLSTMLRQNWLDSKWDVFVKL